jgi:N-acetylmuramoyl-L-alanine amidase
MQPIKVGDSGGPVRDIQDRLFSLDHSFAPDPRGEFGIGTESAVRSFQSVAALPASGEIDELTWRRLVEAGYSLGDRVIYHRRPMLRGKDIADLQQRLNDLGFDAGVVDGIFGPHGASAVLEFQTNRAMSEDGIAGPIVLGELTRLRRHASRIGKEQAVEREWLRRLPNTIVGTRVLFDPACDSPTEAEWTWDVAQRAGRIFQKQGGVSLYSRPADALTDVEIRAARANHLGSEVVVSIELSEEGSGEVLYFDSGFSRSLLGELLATELGTSLGLPISGSPHAILRGTRAPAVVVRSPRIAPTLPSDIVAGVKAFFGKAESEAVLLD